MKKYLFFLFFLIFLVSCSSVHSSVQTTVQDFDYNSLLQQQAIALATLIGAGLGLVGGLFSSTSRRRAEQEREDYQKWVQQETWKREDNAVQRRVADLELAGLSPTLAAGSAAQTSSPINVDFASTSVVGESLQGLGNAVLQGVALNDQLKNSAASRAYQESMSNLNNEKAAGQVLDNARSIFEREHDYPAVRLIEKSIQEKGLSMANQILDMQGKSVDNKYRKQLLEDYIYDSDYYKEKGFSSKGPQSRYGGWYSDLYGGLGHLIATYFS